MNKKINKGFTLVETIVSIAIIAILMIVFSSAFATAAKVIRGTKDTNQESMQAAINLEESVTKIDDGTVTITMGGKDFSQKIDVFQGKQGDVTYQKAVISSE